MMFLPCSFLRHRQFHSFYSLTVGVFMGFVFTSQLRYIVLSQQKRCFMHSSQPLHSDSYELEKDSENQVLNVTNLGEDKRLIFIGVMTAQKYLDTRASAIYNTWGPSVPGKLVFFSSASSKSSSPIPLVALPSVDDSYPPQKKSFLMLKYMHDNFINEFEWFMRADDDVYIRTGHLEKFLRSVNSSKPQFIGQAGMGNKEEFGQLSLEPDENFCMGGPGMIMSRDTLRILIPHIRYCLKNLYSTHEDVEVGRCIRRFVGIPCTWSYEMQSIFYHSFSGEEVFTGRLKSKDVHRAITLHPIKQPPYLYRLHSYFHGLQTQNLRYQSVTLYREILEMEKMIQNSKVLNEDDPLLKLNISVAGMQPLLEKFHPTTKDEILTWDFVSKSMYSAAALNPKRRLESYQQVALNDVVMEVMEMINKYSKQRGRVIDFKEILYGYVREIPLYGIDYIMDLLLTYKKYRGKKMTVPVRRHAYLQKAFSQPEFREEYSQNSKSTERDALQQVINVVLPLSGRTETFKRFLENFEDTCLKADEKVRLAVVLFPDNSEPDSSAEAKRVFEDLKSRYPDFDLRLIETPGTFSRALALEVGAKLFSPDSLLFFIDVDIVIDHGVMKRIRLNTVRGGQAYFPIVFSEYDSELLDKGSDQSLLSDEHGYWRQFGYGIVSIFHSDLRSAGGFDTTIQGWGKEDVDLFSKVVRSNLTVFRAADPGMIHVFHPISCNPQLENSQYEMCWGSKLSSLSSPSRLANLILDNKEKYLGKS